MKSCAGPLRACSVDFVFVLVGVADTIEYVLLCTSLAARDCGAGDVALDQGKLLLCKLRIHLVKTVRMVMIEAKW